MPKIILLLLPILSLTSFGQKKTYEKEFSIPEKTPLFISYYGNLGVHPGVKAGFEYSLFLKEKTKEKKRKIKTIRKTLIFAPSVSFYSHHNSHNGLLVSGDLIWRRYTKKLFIHDVSIGLGYLTKFNLGITYEVTPQGVEEIGGSSRGYLATPLAYSFGKRFTVKESVPTDIFIRTTMLSLFDYNGTIGIDASAEVGVRMSLNFGIRQSKVRTIIKNKVK